MPTTTPRHAAPVFLSFYVVGFLDLVGVATGYIKKDFALSDTAAQLIPSMAFLWFALISIPTGLLQDRQGKRRTVLLSILLTSAGLVFPFLHYSYATVVIGFMIIGIGNTMLQVSANPLLLDVSAPGKEAANLSLSQLIKAVASMLGPIFISALSSLWGDWRLIFPLYALLSLGAALWLWATPIPESRPDKRPASLPSTLRLLGNPFLARMILATALMVGFDVGMNSNIAGYLSTRFGLSLESAGFGISIYFASLMTGRFLGSLLLRRFRPQPILQVGVILNFLGLAALSISPDPFTAGFFLFVSGLGFSNLFPIIFALTVQRMPAFTNEISALIILSICGGAVITPIIGTLSDLYGSQAFLYVLSVCVIYSGYAIRVLRKTATE